MNQYQFLFQNT